MNHKSISAVIIIALIQSVSFAQKPNIRKAFDHAAKQTSAFQVNVKPVLPNYEIDRLSIANVPIWKVF